MPSDADALEHTTYPFQMPGDGDPSENTTYPFQRPSGLPESSLQTQLSHDPSFREAMLKTENYGIWARPMALTGLESPRHFGDPQWFTSFKDVPPQQHVRAWIIAESIPFSPLLSAPLQSQSPWNPVQTSVRLGDSQQTDESASPSASALFDALTPSSARLLRSPLNDVRPLEGIVEAPGLDPTAEAGELREMPNKTHGTGGGTGAWLTESRIPSPGPAPSMASPVPSEGGEELFGKARDGGPNGIPVGDGLTSFSSILPPPMFEDEDDTVAGAQAELQALKATEAELVRHLNDVRENIARCKARMQRAGMAESR
ncbi:hypothetical protein M427DRAFT_428297 [Gonapodya prolifera JEL478]|uniref:Uncharacterized protein n=1 Tax=Gonapodya prolifera (strain JEL478) TaxID=1344416 RepID=A0A139ASK8_GONPJ|nr:hypothetical protein M427DRAFT_428297 [Gonapodya prolifera JEL478]|eukprot:KXS19727.1 hypothetical protein M427DRAFT_428297 [Gonapodya prolifera JEL478]